MWARKISHTIFPAWRQRSRSGPQLAAAQDLPQSRSGRVRARVGYHGEYAQWVTTAWAAADVDVEYPAHESRARIVPTILLHSRHPWRSDGGRAKQAGIDPDNPLHSRHCTWMCRCREAQDVRERPSMAVRCPSRDAASRSSGTTCSSACLIQVNPIAHHKWYLVN